MEPTGRIAEHHVVSVLAGVGDPVEDHRGRVSPLAAKVNVTADAPRPHVQLLPGGGAEGVARDEQHLATLGHVARGELPKGGGLAHAVHPDHQEYVRWGLDREGGGGAALAGRLEHVERRVVDDGPDRVGVCHLGAIEHPRDAVEEFLGGLGPDVGREQHLLDVILEVVGDLGLAADELGESRDKSLPGAGETLLDPCPLRVRVHRGHSRFLARQLHRGRRDLGGGRGRLRR